MLRPATPLSVVLFLAFALLTISVVSTPIIKPIPLGTFNGFSFGVFGFCRPDGSCSSIEIGYDTSTLGGGFDLSNSTRTTLSSILVIHPVAALVTLIMFILAVISHTHSASHSSRFLLLVFIFSIIDFLLCLLAFLIDVLLFVPHMAFGTYIVLAATILVALASLISCAMRRTVVGRKARKKRIAENAEMSGENFYNRQAQEIRPVMPTATSLEPTVPMLSGANGPGDNKLPEFAAFEKKDDRSSDDRLPLTARSLSDRSPNTLTNDMASTPSDLPYSGPLGPNQPRRSMSNSTLERDQYGNPIQPPQDGYGMRRGPSVERMNSRGRGGPPPGGYRGRGGYPGGPGRGGYNNPNGGRGGYGPPGRGGYGPPGGRGGYGPPPRGYGPGMRGGRTPPPPSYQSGPGSYDRRGSPAGSYGPGPYGGARQPSPGPGFDLNPSVPSVSTGSYDAYNPQRNSLPRAESPPPLHEVDEHLPGQAIEMDATTGSPQHPPAGFGQFGIRDSDADIAGMLAMQQGQIPSHEARRHDTYMSDVSRYSQEENAYVPPRQAWTGQGPGRNSPRMPSPLNVASRDTPSLRGSPAPQPLSAPPPGEYYEDVDPRFVAAPPPVVDHRPTPPPIQTTNNFEGEDIPQGARSPAESERSTFTSISQRGINPRWNPPPPPHPGRGGFGNNLGVPRRPVNRTADVVLNSNPDFELPSRGGRGPGAGGMVPGSAYPAL